MSLLSSLDYGFNQGAVFGFDGIDEVPSACKVVRAFQNLHIKIVANDKRFAVAA